MKRMIRVASNSTATQSDYYDRYFTYNYGGQKFSGYIKYEDEPWNLQFTLSEIHPYDDAEYCWAKKDRPNSVSVFQKGYRVTSIDVPEYDEDIYKNENEYVDSVIDWTCKCLREMNSRIKPVMVHN